MGALTNAFKQARVTRTTMVVDLVGSTSMKERDTEANWLTTYEYVFDLVGEMVKEHRGTVVKYLGDGVMAVFPEDGPADAINCSIRIQEEMADARDQRRVDCECSIGITYGLVVEFEAGEGKLDYIGSLTDKAFRLCSAANGSAIFVDVETVDAAPMNRVHSRIGTIDRPRRSISDYRGEKESVKAKGFRNPIEYHEILWAHRRFSVRPEFVTKLSNDEPPAAGRVVTRTVSTATPVPTAMSAGWTRGIVERGLDRFGFIRSADGEAFWFNASTLFLSDAIPEEAEDVWFLPAPALTGANNRRALDILPLGGRLTGVLQAVKDGYGFVVSTNQHLERRQLFVSLDTGTRWGAGMEIEFVIDENRKGPIGVDPRLKPQKTAA
jgi:class 3 adenylate cyclase